MKLAMLSFDKNRAFCFLIRTLFYLIFTVSRNPNIIPQVWWQVRIHLCNRMSIWSCFRFAIPNGLFFDLVFFFGRLPFRIILSTLVSTLAFFTYLFFILLFFHFLICYLSLALTTSRSRMSWKREDCLQFTGIVASIKQPTILKVAETETLFRILISSFFSVEAPLPFNCVPGYKTIDWVVLIVFPARRRIFKLFCALMN